MEEIQRMGALLGDQEARLWFWDQEDLPADPPRSASQDNLPCWKLEGPGV